jgi:NAD(P)-dependent dehydrogenase (short-subunit alcohol dehydrogenase family)
MDREISDQETRKSEAGEISIMHTVQRLLDRVAIVTGGGRGIGKAVALAYAREGANVAVVARTSQEIARTASEIEDLGRKGLAIQADICIPEDVNQIVDTVLGTFGKVDILFNAAGVRAVAPSEELSYEDWKKVIEVNLTGSFLCSQRVAEPMKKAGYGKIIMMGSMQAHSGAPFRAAYIASKTGLVGLTRGLGVEWARYGINVNILSPGYFETDIILHQIEIGQLDLEAIERRTPMGRIGKMVDLTGPAVFLASSESDFMCGQALIVDGGWMAYGFLQM